MLRCGSVLDFVKKVDYEFYQNLVDVLIPDVLRSIPSPLTQAIRNFAKSLEGWLSNALIGYPSEFIEVKVSHHCDFTFFPFLFYLFVINVFYGR